MKRVLTLMAVVAVVALAVPAMAQWTARPDNPSWWPYGDYPLGVGGQPSPSLQSLGLTAYSGDPLYGTAGYWPRSNGSGVFANGVYYAVGGYGPYDLLQDPADAGSSKYFANRQSGFDIYDPGTGTWSSSKYDGTGPTGYNQGNGGALPTVGQGTYIGNSQAIAANVDLDGTQEILVHGGYPVWTGAFGVYDPDTDSWGYTAGALAFSGGLTAQYLGASVEVGGKVYCLGGYFWGPDNMINGQAYDIGTDTWTVLGEDMLSGAVSQQFAGVAIGTDIYLLGGAGSSTQILKYDTLTNSLTDTGDALLAGVARAAAVAWNGQIILLGGQGAGGNVNLVQVYDPVTGTVHLGHNLPEAMSRQAAAIDGNTIYLGGLFQNGDGINDNNLWTSDASYVVPEPGTMTLIGVGLLSLIAFKRRKR